MLFRIATRRIRAVLGSRRPGEAPLACLSAQRKALANWILCRASLSWSSLGTAGQGAEMCSSLLHNQHARTQFGRSPARVTRGVEGVKNSAPVLQATTGLER